MRHTNQSCWNCWPWIAAVQIVRSQEKTMKKTLLRLRNNSWRSICIGTRARNADRAIQKRCAEYPHRSSLNREVVMRHRIISCGLLMTRLSTQLYPPANLCWCTYLKVWRIPKTHHQLWRVLETYPLQPLLSMKNSPFSEFAYFIYVSMSVE